MIYVLLASFFYSNVIYRLPVGSYGYVLISDVVSWIIILIFFIKKISGRTETVRSESRVGFYLVIINILMYLLLIRVYFGANRVFSEFGRAAVDTLRFTQFILGYYAIRSSNLSLKASWRYLKFIFFFAFPIAVFGLVMDVALAIPRHYAWIDKDVLRPEKVFTAFFTNNHGSAVVFLLAALSIGFALFLKKTGIIGKTVTLCFMSVIAIALIFTQSRAGLLGFTAASMLFVIDYVLLQKKKFLAFLTIGLVSVLATGMLVYLVAGSSAKNYLVMADVKQITNFDREKDHIKSTDQKLSIISIRSRFDNWNNSLRLIRNMSYDIVFGYGVNQQTFLANYGGAHNNFLEFFIDMGIVGFLLFLMLLYQINKIFNADNVCDDDTKALLLGVKCGFVGLIVTAFTQETFYMVPAMGNFFGFYLIMLAFVEKIKGKSMKKDGDGVSDLLPKQIEGADYIAA